MSDGYNGWKNYETWNCALWFDNDEGTQRYMVELAGSAREDNPGDRDSQVGDLARRIEDFVEENMPEMDNTFYLDILLAAMGEVDYYEIAEHYLDDLEPEDEDEDEEAADSQQ